uniref:Uncharacterized protein n=1 Tax=Rhizophagus irregularis (strain DAOM 181602 / DAOM 197198 / MUCL 43194) TaxID=747089 RepID=U9UTE2_RHIID
MTNLTKPITKQIIKTRGESLENDLRALLYNERFFDIKLKCSNGIVLGAYNIIEIYHATEYFELDILQKHIIEYTKQILEYENDDTGKKLLSNFVNKYWFNNDNEISQVLIDWLAKISLVPDEAEKDSLSLMGLRYFLCKTYDTRKPFATFELDIFEYIIIKIVKIILTKVDKIIKIDIKFTSRFLSKVIVEEEVIAATGCSGMVIGTLVYGTSYCIIPLKFVEDVLHDAALETLMSFIGKVVAPKIIRYKTSKGIAKIITARDYRIYHMFQQEILSDTII